MLEMLLLKVIISVVVVLGVTYIAERTSTRFAGVLMGFPLGTAIILFFLGLENGIEFASSSAIWAINGLVAETIFIFCYFLGVIHFKKFPVIMSLFLALIGFFGSAMIIRQLPFSSPLASSLFLGIFIVLSILFYRKIELNNITKVIKTPRVTIFYRVLATAAVVLLITGISNLIGKEWSGILASLPTNLVVVLLVIHLSHERKYLLTMIRGYPIGLIGLLIYLLTIPFTYSFLGVIVGTVMSYLIAGIYLLIYEFILRTYIQKYV